MGPEIVAQYDTYDVACTSELLLHRQKSVEVGKILKSPPSGVGKK